MKPLFHLAQIGLAFALLTTAGCSIGQAPFGETDASPAVTVVVVARDLSFDPSVVRLRANTPTAISLDNRDPGILHNISIVTPDGVVVLRGETFAGIKSRTYRVPALPAKEFQFVCDVHPGMTGRLIVATGW